MYICHQCCWLLKAPHWSLRFQKLYPNDPNKESLLLSGIVQTTAITVSWSGSIYMASRLFFHNLCASLSSLIFCHVLTSSHSYDLTIKVIVNYTLFQTNPLCSCTVHYKKQNVTFENRHSCNFGRHIILIRVMLVMECIPGTLGMMQEYTMNETPVHDRTPCTHTHSPLSHLILTSPSAGMFLGAGRKPCRHRENRP